MENVKPDIVTVALDPEASGPGKCVRKAESIRIHQTGDPMATICPFAFSFHLTFIHHPFLLNLHALVPFQRHALQGTSSCNISN